MYEKPIISKINEKGAYTVYIPVAPPAQTVVEELDRVLDNYRGYFSIVQYEEGWSKEGSELEPIDLDKQQPASHVELVRYENKMWHVDIYPDRLNEQGGRTIHLSATLARIIHDLVEADMKEQTKLRQEQLK